VEMIESATREAKIGEKQKMHAIRRLHKFL